MPVGLAADPAEPWPGVELQSKAKPFRCYTPAHSLKSRFLKTLTRAAFLTPSPLPFVRQMGAGGCLSASCQAFGERGEGRVASTPVWPQQALSGLRLRSEPDHDLCLRPGQALLMCGQRRAILQPAVLLDALHPSLNPSNLFLLLQQPAGLPSLTGGSTRAPPPPPAASLVLVRRVKVPPDVLCSGRAS